MGLTHSLTFIRHRTKSKNMAFNSCKKINPAYISASRLKEKLK